MHALDDFLSQVLHYKLDSDQLQLEPTELQAKSFSSYLEQFIQPFQMKINSKNLKVECSFQHDGRVCNDYEFEFFKPKMLTDFKIYSCILFNLISNAVKHCHKDSKIAIVVELIPFDEPGFSGKLSTKITNEGSVKDLKYQRGDVSFKTFQ